MLSSAALATPIQSYTGQEMVASKVSPTTEAGLASSGLTAMVSELNEYADTCTAVDTSVHGVVRNLPPRAVSGLAKASECTTPSSRSTCSPIASASPARCSSLVTSTSSSGGTGSSFLITRPVRLMARPKLETITVAPSAWAIRATWKAIEVSRVTPATRMFLPSRIPTAVPPPCSGVVLVRLLHPPSRLRSKSLSDPSPARRPPGSGRP